VARRGDGLMVPTPLLSSLAQAAIDIRPALIVVDSIAATFGGNQNDRVHARTFIGISPTTPSDGNPLVINRYGTPGPVSNNPNGGLGGVY
jgi:hypothetical protein